MTKLKSQPAEYTAATSEHMVMRDWALLISLAAIWGTSFLVIKIALTALPIFTIVTLRVGLAAIALYGGARAMGIRLKTPEGVRVKAIIGAFLVLALFNNVVPFTLIVWGQTHISVTLASILNATMPLFTVFLAHFLVRGEHLTLRRLLGVVIGFLGVVTVIAPTASEALTGDFWGQLAMLGAACSYGFSVVMARRFSRFGLHSVHIALGQMLVATLFMVPVALIVDQPWRLDMPGGDVWAAVGVLAFLCSALAYVLYFKLIGSAGATNASLVTLLVPAFAIFMGVTLLGETFELEQALGLGLIATGLLVLDGRPYRYVAASLARIRT